MGAIPFLAFAFKNGVSLNVCCPGALATPGGAWSFCQTVLTQSNTPIITCYLNGGTNDRRVGLRLDVPAGTPIASFSGLIRGSIGQRVGANAGGLGQILYYQNPDSPDYRQLTSPFNIGLALNIRDGQTPAIASSSVAGVDYGAGGSYSAIGDADCFASRNNDFEFRAGETDCRWAVAAGGGGAST
ncbi:hypothetical protein Rhopal_007042-T1 [Rhodotorula paludigena]|uniref:Uncharacterized protein n=1 Tax=Rhodotorula paludigena TaxID=86838 RepID=A0AAV5GXU2_9BASI|nr:hypothetical protein Rhopal_007042-T1 [Rhodotorula paludigena]